MPDITSAALACAAVLEHEAGTFDVGAERVLEVDEIGAHPGEVHDVREVVGQIAEVAGREVDRPQRHPGGLELLARRASRRVGGGVATAVNASLARTSASGEARDAPHVVVGREMERERGADACRSRR